MEPLYYIAKALKSRIVEEVGFALKVLSNFLVIFVQFAQRNPPQMANVLAPASYESKTVNMAVLCIARPRVEAGLYSHYHSLLWLGILMHFESAEHNKSSLKGSHLVKAGQLGQGNLLKQNDCGARKRIPVLGPEI
ncbi:hypothetical protein NA56DRAFT_711542 [Hyaloscypha hepaticicola]|uniref:Uncharacterized protein n=1 Tax=Hyaloscypha hepaticicola TaxID=2082293 RepID=A0A2J6PIT0_9HELO|nr:hypothetical protein NA56DRAFT_711542 [Hyaloscypha hepaticicola]